MSIWCYATKAGEGLMRRHYRAISIVVVFALVLASASTAWAYFTTTGRGLGSGSIASLSAPSVPNV